MCPYLFPVYVLTFHFQRRLVFPLEGAHKMIWKSSLGLARAKPKPPTDLLIETVIQNVWPKGGKEHSKTHPLRFIDSCRVFLLDTHLFVGHWRRTLSWTKYLRTYAHHTVFLYVEFPHIGTNVRVREQFTTIATVVRTYEVEQMRNTS